MTTQIPTSNLPLSGSDTFPNPQDLQAWASALFNAAPGSQTITPPQPASVGSHSNASLTNAPHPHSELVLNQESPVVQPHSGLSLGNTPRESNVSGGSNGGFGAERIYAAALPSVDAPAAPSSSAYYFLDQNQSENGNSFLDTLVAEALHNDRTSAQSFALPGQNQLVGLDQSSGLKDKSASPISFGFLDDLHTVELGAVQKSAPLGLLDVESIRRDFPILAERVNGKPLIWFDNAATTHKPQSVIDRIAYFYAHENSNIHRAAHELAARATDAYESARQKVADFIGASGPDEIVFVRGATEAINLVANTFGKANIGAGDEIIVSNLEHHANIVPWQLLAAEKGAKIRVIPVDDDGQLLLDEYRKLLNPRTKLVAVTQVSNALGTVTPIAEVIALAHAHGVKVLVDGAQSVSHMRVNVRALDADFFVFSGHKVFAPTGIGVVYGKKKLLETLPPYQGGGNMIADVTFERTLFHGAPARFEAGTGNIADAVGLGAAIDYVNHVGIERIAQYEHALLEYATDRLKVIPGVRLIGTAREKASVLSFVLNGYKTEEVGNALNKEGIAVRSGHHCAQPILRRMGVEATVRPSLAFYNTCEEVDTFIRVIRKLSAR